MHSAAIVPTGDELVAGIVVDTNGPAVRDIILRRFPDCDVLCCEPVPDSAAAIGRIVRKLATGHDLVVVTGGSGGGGRCDRNLAEDCTHGALAACTQGPVSREIYGPNGHLWCNIVVGSCDGALVFNVPGPGVEAVAAAAAAIECLEDDVPVDRDFLADRIAEAVVNQYPIP